MLKQNHKNIIKKIINNYEFNHKNLKKYINLF